MEALKVFKKGWCKVIKKHATAKLRELSTDLK